MYDLQNFTEENFYDCALALRNMISGAQCMEEVANRMIRFLFDKCVQPQTGKSSCALIRFFKTHSYGDLPPELQLAACDIVSNRPIDPATKCLTLLATVGDEPHWNVKEKSTGHRAIPLIDADFVKRAPMIFRLIEQFGLGIDKVLSPAPSLIVETERKIHNTFTFYIPEAFGSDCIPAQQEFVIPYQIQSVLGFGGLLFSGDLFVVILFGKTWIPPETVNYFKWISAYAWIAAAAFD
jgi:hypothetical protein